MSKSQGLKKFITKSIVQRCGEENEILLKEK
ncbi:hypothetical protein HNQ02_002868 [Flavobacterium sp. 7E]|nr:hypothetical protein [Flavobacterium sp. PL002]NRS89933.1 hypothetical protein [Flavobacterium sp. 7E]NRT16757.1 hypothetical protein [Flavobacterium sp. 28A]